MHEYESPTISCKDHLIDRIATSSNLNRAYQRVKRNRGAPGVDGMTTQALSGYLKSHGKRVQILLKVGMWMPQPVRRVVIPKPQGGERKLGIPTVLDRLVQQAIQQILQDDWESRFSVHSYGFRPGKSAHQACRQAQGYIESGYDWVVDIDLSKFFDRVNHDRLMAKLAAYTDDKDVLRLVRRFLNAGVMENGIVQYQQEGTPQGGPLSPILSNIVLDELDKELDKRELRYVRYADDCRVFVKSRKAAQRVMHTLVRFIETRMKLKVNREKSAIARPWERTFLGFSFTREGSLTLPESSRQRFKSTVKKLTRKLGKSFSQRLAALNRYLRGWRQYFGEIDTQEQLTSLEGWTRRRLRCLLWFQWKTGRKRFKVLRRLGVSVTSARKAAGSRKKYWRMSASPALSKGLSIKCFDRLGLERLRMV